MSSSSCSRMRPMTKCTNLPFGLASSPNHYNPSPTLSPPVLCLLFLFLSLFTARHTSIRISISLVRGPDLNTIGVHAGDLDGISLFLNPYSSCSRIRPMTMRTNLPFVPVSCFPVRFTLQNERNDKTIMACFVAICDVFNYFYLSLILQKPFSMYNALYQGIKCGILKTKGDYYGR